MHQAEWFQQLCKMRSEEGGGTQEKVTQQAILMTDQQV